MSMNKYLKCKQLSNRKTAMLTLDQTQMINLAKSYKSFLSLCIKRGIARKKALIMDKQV